MLIRQKNESDTVARVSPYFAALGAGLGEHEELLLDAVQLEAPHLFALRRLDEHALMLLHLFPAAPHTRTHRHVSFFEKAF